ncbi:HD domain-containing phosphohydrolase [Sulfurimonas sp.]|uniref:HD domain-containing phosphohydrolase n=1 Tax=Sulfurimonas sp. TaxID=2022749 RepID=UPI0025E07117|nr:HD domain-containing phosphohydrolase [Sulfurimonas sp.]MDD5158148.1 HD domain-containing protein [Sulfurimonas sp.]
MSFKLKTIFLFLGISLTPYILTMILLGSSYREEQHKIITKELNSQLNTTVEKIDQHLSRLYKDIEFMSKSDVMNDIYTQDLDRRISTILLAKKNDMRMNGEFYVTDTNQKIIASSDFSSLNLIKKLNFFYSVPIESTITKQNVGTLSITYPLENLKTFFLNSPQRHYYIRDNSGTTYLRPTIFDKSLSASKTVPALPNITIVLEEEKSFAYRLLYKYEQWFATLLFVGAIFIALAAYFVATNLISPVITLLKTAKKITKTQDYTQQVEIHRDDEVGQLANAFNTMIKGIDKALNEVTALNKEVEDTQREVVFTMGSIGESRSKETGNHVKRVAEYSKLLALYYGLSGEESEMLKQASPMHDIGKVAIPDAVLNKPGRFDEDERRIMDTHAALGYDMLKHSNRPLLLMAATVAYEHHEKWDGSGYPRGLSEGDIHIYGRITALADVFDALGSDRIYKKAWEDEKIFAFFKEERGKHFDPALIDIFFNHLDEFLLIRDSFKDVH